MLFFDLIIRWVESSDFGPKSDDIGHWISSGKNEKMKNGPKDLKSQNQTKPACFGLALCTMLCTRNSVLACVLLYFLRAAAVFTRLVCRYVQSYQSAAIHHLIQHTCSYCTRMMLSCKAWVVKM